MCAMLVLSVMPLALAEGTYEIAMITDNGNIDDQSFNQYTWEGVKVYAEENGITYGYFKPSEDSTDARIEQITAAIDKGAKTIVCPGYLFQEAIEISQEMYPDVNFLFLDFQSDWMANGATPNTHCIVYKEEQAGYFAGYATVKDGYKKLGFLGGIAVPAVVRYGFGFVQGAEAAALEMGSEDIEINYWYSNSFVADDAIKTKMASWITGGTEIIFSCGGGILNSALKACEEGNAKAIGVDVDQAYISPLIITSAMKNLQKSVTDSLAAEYDNGGTWPEELAGQTSVLGAAEDGVGLPLAEDSWRFSTFTVDEYNTLLEKVISGELVVSEDIENKPEVSSVTVDYQE